MLAILGRSWASTLGPGALLAPLCGRSCAALGAYLGGLGRSWGLSWRSWAALGAYVGGLGPKNAKSMPTLKMYVFLERERDLRPEGGLGPLLGLMLAVLGRSWSLCWRSWAALGTYVGGLGPNNVKNMATLKMCLFLERERDLRPGGRS